MWGPCDGVKGTLVKVWEDRKCGRHRCWCHSSWRPGFESSSANDLKRSIRISTYRIPITGYSQPHHYHWPAMVGRMEPNSRLNPEVSSLPHSAPFSPATVLTPESSLSAHYLHSPELTRDFTSLHRACDQLSATHLGRIVTAFVGEALSAQGRGATCQGHTKVTPRSHQGQQAREGQKHQWNLELWDGALGTFQSQLYVLGQCFSESLHQLHQSHYQQAWLN